MLVTHITVVIKLPDNQTNKAKILDELKLMGDFHGGTVTAMSLRDEISALELLEDEMNECGLT